LGVGDDAARKRGDRLCARQYCALAQLPLKFNCRLDL
jgi:hypothetical protein